ncbi:hypothetical protein MOQ_003668 [Trypanosoma cruzi marinkellei]|uniref:Chorein N-terminal domain-containing protein n=1 Tax=Trypanosoma cruzi marinkellei TaxID=85056 RepID=K2N3I0_TRYCR|nr:hypothetical protein MOQ_003668 [Trypanosoma cruzi marinkellei]
MLERQLSVLLATYLSRFICDLNEEQLRVSLWSGDLVLRDLELRTNIIDQIILFLFQARQEGGGHEEAAGGDAAKAVAQALMTPFTVVKGVVKKLTITVPWAAIDREPISVEVHGVEILFGLLRGRPHNADEDAARVMVVKQKQLHMFELGRLDGRTEGHELATGAALKSDTGAGAKKNLSYVENLIETIKRNIHVVMRDVSLNYVVNYHGLAPCFTCALRVSLDYMCVTTTDEEWEDRFVMDLSMPYRKKVVMSGLRVSVHGIEKQHVEAAETPGDGSSKWQREMNIVEVEDLTVRLHLSGDKESTDIGLDAAEQSVISVKTTAPIQLRASFGVIGVLAIINDSLKNGLLGLNYRQHLHFLSKGNEENLTWAQRRWKFALCCVMDDVRRSKNKTKGHQRFIEGVVLFGKRRREYCALWKRCQGVAWLPPLTPDEKDNLNTLEELLTVEQIVFLRCLAYADLSKERQSMRQQKLYIEDVKKRREIKKQSAESSGSRWRWWWWLRQGNVHESANVSETNEPESVAGGFEAEWEFGYNFLQYIATRHVVGNSMKSSSSSCSASTATMASTKPILIGAQFPQVDVEFEPHAWRNDLTEKKPLLSYLENLQQNLKARFNSVVCKYAVTSNPQEELVGFSLSIESASVGFTGSLPSAVLDTLELCEGNKRGNDVVDSNFMREPWLSITVNETHSMLSAFITSTSLTLQPWCELQWWMAGVQDFLAALPEYTKQEFGSLCEVPNSHNHISSLPTMDINFAEVILTVPLFSEYGNQRQLVVRAPGIHLSSVSEKKEGKKDQHRLMREPPPIVDWHFFVGEEEPVRLYCEGIGDILVLSYVRVDVASAEQLSAVVSTRAKLAIAPSVLELINNHMKYLDVLQGDVGESLLCEVMNNNGRWRLESDTAISVGGTLMTFPGARCRSFLRLLHQSALARGVDHRESTVPSAAEATPPLLHRLVLRIDFAHATLRNTNNEDVVEVELPGVENSGYEEASSFGSLPSKDAFVLDMTSSVMNGYNSLICLPDVHVTAPSGQHVFVLEGLTVMYSSTALMASAECGVLDIRVCQSLVDCVELLLMSCASWQPTPSSDLVTRPRLEKNPSVTVLSGSDAHTGQVIEMNLKRLNLCFQFHQTDECVAVHLNDLLLRADSSCGGQNLKLQGSLDRVEYIAEDAEDAEGVKTFKLLASSTGLLGSVEAPSFTCTVESTTVAGGGGLTRVSFHLRGGRVGVFYAYWMRLLSMRYDSTVVSLLNLLGSDDCRRDSPDTPKSRQEISHESTPASAAKAGPGLIVISGEVKALELLLATDATREVDWLNSETYCYLFVDGVSFLAETPGDNENSRHGSRTAAATPPSLRGQMKLFGISQLSPGGSENVLLPFISQVSLIFGNYTRLVPNAEKSGYEYVKGGSEDMAVHVLIGPSDHDGKANEVPAEAAMDVKLTMPMLNALLWVFSANIFNASPLADGVQESEVTMPTVGGGKLVSTTASLSSPPSLSFLVTVSSVRFVLIKEPDIFVMRAQFQVYLFDGGKGEDTLTQMIHFNALTIDDISPHRRVMRREIPQWQQQQQGVTRETHTSQKKRMLEVESGCISTSRVLEGVNNTILAMTTNVVLNGVHFSTARCSWTSLVGMLLLDVSAAAWTALTNGSSKVQGESTSKPSTLEVTVHQIHVQLELPWEEPLAELSVRSMGAQFHECGGSKIAEFSLDDPISLIPYFNHTPQVNILEWGDMSQETTPTTASKPFLHVIFTESYENWKEYDFHTSYEEKPQICYPNRVEVTLQSLRLVADVNFMTRLLRFASDEAEAYSLLLSNSTSVKATPMTFVTVMDISVKDLRVLFSTPEPTIAPRWYLTVEGVKLTHECVETAVSDKPLGGMECMSCFSNVYTVNVYGAFLSCQQLYPLRLPNTVVRAQIPIPQSIFTEWKSTVSVTPDDRAHVRSTFNFVPPSSLTDPQSIPSFCKLIHIQTEYDASLSFSALHVRDALRALPLEASSEDVPPYYNPPVKLVHAPVCATSSVSVTLPRFSIRLTESGHVNATADACADGENGASGNCLTNSAVAAAAILAEIRFLEVVVLSASFFPHDEITMRTRLSIQGAFELLDGNGVVVLYRHGSATLAHEKQQPSRHLRDADDAGLQVDVTDTQTERRMCLESNGIIISLRPHTVDFVLRMHNVIGLMHHEGLFVVEGKHNTSNSWAKNEGDADAAEIPVSQNEKQTVLVIRVAHLLLIMENTALLEARNVESRLSWKDGSTASIDTSIPYNIFIGDLLLRETDSHHIFVSISALELSLGVGEVSIRANPFIINNYDVLFYARLWNSAEALYLYVLQNVTFSKKHEDGFQQTVLVTLTDVRVCFFISREHRASGETDGRMEIVFPVVILKQKASTVGSRVTFETENGIIRYRRPEGRLPPFVKNICFSCFVENGLVTQSSSVMIRLSGIEAFIPLGDTLQCCAEAVAQAFLPLLSVFSTAYRNVDVGPSPTIDVPATPLVCDRLVFNVPLVSLNVCASQSDEEELVERPAVLFGVSFRNIVYERSRTGVNEKTLAQIQSVTSTVDETLQKEFVSAKAPNGVLDEPSQWALYFCKKVSSGERKAFLPSSSPTDEEKEQDGGGYASQHEQLPRRLVSVIFRAHAVKLTVSPRLLSTLNEHVLLHVASGVHRIRSMTASLFSSRRMGDSGSSWSHSPVRDPNDRVIIITSDCLLSTDLTLGGKHGSCLRFSKGAIASNPHNKITVKGINHAKVFVSIFVTPDGALKPPIVVDPGLTVMVEGVPFVTERGKLTDYVDLGARSLFLAPTEIPTANSHGYSVNSLDTPTATVPLNTVRWYNVEVMIDASIDVALCLWSIHQSIEVSGEAYARYKLEKNCYEGNRGVRDFIDESGEVALSNVSILCDSGPITKNPAGLMVYVKHYKLKEDHTNAGMTVVRAIFPNISFTLSLGNLRLLYDTIDQLKQGLNHIASTMEMTTTRESTQHKDENENLGNGGNTFPGGMTYSPHAEPSLLWSRDGELTPLIEFGASAAWMELILTNDFYRPEVAIVFSSSALMAKGTRSFNRMTWTASTTVRVTDYPQLQPSRDLLLVSPEVAVEYARYAGGGFSLQGAVTCPELSVTLPLVTALRLLRFRFDLQRTGAYSFRNCTGIPLLLLAVMKVNKKNTGEKTPFCRLPPGKLVKASIFHYNQTRFRIIADNKEDIDECDGNLSMSGAEVDLSALQRGATCRFPLVGPSLGALDIVMRLDEMGRIVDITTSVEIKNELATLTVCLPGTPFDPCTVKPKETCYATLPCLRHPFSLTVGEWRLKTRNALVTLETLINAFTLLSPERNGTLASSLSDAAFVAPRRAYMEDDDTLVFPLTLSKGHDDEGRTEAGEKSEEKMRVLLVLTRRIALENEPRTSRLLPHYEVELRVCPMVAVFNETGAALAVTMIPSSFSDAAAHKLTFLRGEEEFNCFSQGREGETLMMELTCEFAEGVRLCSAEPLPLTFTGTTTVVMKDPVGGRMAALLVERAAHSKFIVRAAAILVNALPFPVRVYDGSNALILGQKGEVGLKSGGELPLTLPIIREQLPRPDTAVSVRVVAGGFTAKSSQQFTCNAPTVSGMLQSVDGDVVRIFRAQRSGGIKKVFAPTPVVRLEPMWIFRNQCDVLPLTVCPVGMTESVVIEPHSQKEWTTFSLSSASDPLIQVRYGRNEEELFMWSEPFKLVTLVGSNVSIVMRHRMHEKPAETGESVLSSSVVKAGVAVFTSMRIPIMAGDSPTCEHFACLGITPWRRNGIFYVDFSLDAKVPVVVENRTERSLQYEHVIKSYSAPTQFLRAYIILPFTDGVTCLDNGDTAHVMRITLFDKKKPPQQCVIDLAKAAATHEAVRASQGMFVLCTYDYRLQRYYVSVTTDRSLENRLLFQSRYIIHVEMFIRSLSLYIASICVPKEENTLQKSPLAVLVTRNQLQLGRVFTPEDSTNAEVLAALKCRELDIVLIQALGIYSALSVNEKHCFGRLDVGRLAFIDCTNPRPAHPVIIGLNSGETRRGTSNDKMEKPSLSVNVHALVPGESTAVNVSRASVKDVLLPLQHLRVDVAPVTVKLVDSFLFILRQAGICIWETTQQTVSTRTMEELEEERHSHVDHLASPSSFEEIPVYNCQITQLNISRIDLDLTITRRSDGKFDPFAGITLGSRFIPSVERAPLSISEVERRDVSQRGSSPYSALLSLLWPSYRNQLMLQFYKIIGSLEILGNPLALISGFQRGVHSFVVEVADMNPAKGAREFLLATTSSTLHTVGLLSRVGSRTAATLSWDNDWLETRGEDARINDPMNRSGVLLGMAQGLRDGIEGVLSRPLSGARATGFTGFCTGIATGAVGLLTRPVAGALDGFGNTAEFYSKLLQEPDEIPKAHLSYLESERNFIAAAVINPSKFSATGRASSSDSVKSSASSTASGSTAGPCANFTEFLMRLGPSKKLNTDACEFVSRVAYDWIERNVRREASRGEDATRALKRSAGVHNYALYADWNSFVANATPEEFYNWVHVALAAALGKEMESALSSGDVSGGGFAPSKLQRPREFLLDTQEDRELAVALERAEVIKSTLGTRDLLKYVSLEHIFLVCSLDEVKLHFSPGMIYKDLPQLILSGARESLIYILCGGVED